MTDSLNQEYMKERKKLHNRSLITAAVAAAFMMVIFGAAHRSLTTLLSIPENFSSMPPDALDEFPMQINQWVGVEEPLDEAVIEATDTDAHISRRYYRYDSPQEVWLYIAAGKRARDLMPHRPEVCYIGAGWTLTNNDSRELSLDSGTVLPCNIFQFTKGTLNPKKIVILDYYIVDGQICRDISLLRSKIWRGSGYVDYVIQVQGLCACDSRSQYRIDRENGSWICLRIMLVHHPGPRRCQDKQGPEYTRTKSRRLFDEE